MSTSVLLPPSTAGTTGIDMNRVENPFNDIANSIDQLGMSHMSRHTDVIYDSIIETMHDKTVAKRNGFIDELLRIYQNKIDDLIREKDYANRLMNQYHQTIIQDTPEPEDMNDKNESNVTMQE